MINDPVTFNKCYKLLSRVRLYHKVKTIWSKEQRYSKENPDHERLLMSIWDTLKPNEKLESRVSHKWIEIGFHGQDPATNLRGSGIIGLRQLASFVTDLKYSK